MSAPHLSRRQREVLTGVAHGMQNGEIAAGLYVSEATVKWHMGWILRRLGARSRAHAVALAIRDGLIEAPAREDEAA